MKDPFLINASVYIIVSLILYVTIIKPSTFIAPLVYLLLFSIFNAIYGYKLNNLLKLKYSFGYYVISLVVPYTIFVLIISIAEDFWDLFLITQNFKLFYFLGTFPFIAYFIGIVIASRKRNKK